MKHRKVNVDAPKVINSTFTSIKTGRENKMTKNKHIRVLVYRRPNMFRINDNLFNLTGFDQLKNLYEIENYKSDHKELVLYYPERFLNILEQRVLIERLIIAGYKEVDIHTHSVYIIQCSDNTFIADGKYELIEEGNFKLSNESSGLPNNSILNIL